MINIYLWNFKIQNVSFHCDSCAEYFKITINNAGCPIQWVWGGSFSRGKAARVWS